MSRPRIFRARALLPAPDRWIEDGGLVIRGGRVERVLTSAAAVRRSEHALGRRATDVGGLLTAGLVDAHVHLELSLLGPVTAAGADFPGWVRGLLAARAGATPAELADGVVSGARRLLATGTTTGGDVDSTGAGLAAFGRHALRLVHYREVLDARDPERTAAARRSVERALERRQRRTEGISPHAPFTVGPDLFRAAGLLARRRSLPVAIHWSETPEERDYLERGTGPLALVLGPSPRAPGLDLIEAAGLLGPVTALIHGNHPRPGEPERIADAGATLVHCPGSHAWFGREPFALDRYRDAGVHLALGTDSLASNADLDMRREMRLLRAGRPDLDPELVWTMATLGGARALGLAGRVGVLAPGAWADFCVHDLSAPGRASALEALTAGQAEVLATRVAGRAAAGADGGAGALEIRPRAAEET